MTDIEARRPAQDRAAIAGLAALTLLLFAPALHPGRVFFERDIANYWYPQVESFVRAVAEGSWPLWNPYFSFGFPMWADPAYQITYPPTWLNLILRPATYYKAFVLFHCLFTAVGLYALGRRLRLSPLSAFVAAVAWCLSGPFLSTVNLFHHFAGAAWVPWVLVALHRALCAPAIGAGLVLGAAAALQVLAGSGDVVVMTALLSGGLAALFVCEQDPRGRLRQLARTLLVALPFAVILCAIQWIPTAAYVVEGRRLENAASNMYWSVHPAALVDLVVPRLVAQIRWALPLQARMFEGREPLLASLYLGLAAASLAVLSCAGSAASLRRAATGAFVVFVVLALGRFVPAVPFILHLPPFSLFRYPVKYLIAAAIPWALLVGLGMEAWRTEWTAREKRVGQVAALVFLALSGGALLAADQARRGVFNPLFLDGTTGPAQRLATLRLLGAAVLAGSMAILLWLRGRRSRPAGWSTVAVSTLVVIDLMLAGRLINPVAPAELLGSVPPMLSAMGPKADHVRLLVRIGGTLDALGRSITPGTRGWSFLWRSVQGYQDMLPPPIAARWRLDGSFDGNFTGLAPPSIDRLSWMATATRDPWLALRMLQLGAVEYLVTLHDPVAQGLEEVGRYASVYTDPIRLYRVPGSLPRTYAVGGARTPDWEEAFRLIASADFDPRQEVLLDPGTTVMPPPPAFAGSSEIVERSFNRVVIDADTNADGYVVLVETYVRGWTATVDGAATDVLRANTAFRAVRVPRGRHRVELRYQPRAVLYGAGLTAAGLVFGLGFWEWQRRQSSRVAS